MKISKSSLYKIGTSLNDELRDVYLKSMEEAMERAKCEKCIEHKYFYKYDSRHLLKAFLFGVFIGSIIWFLKF